jgi:hypothetical protein
MASQVSPLCMSYQELHVEMTPACVGDGVLPAVVVLIVPVLVTLRGPPAQT